MKKLPAILLMSMAFGVFIMCLPVSYAQDIDTVSFNKKTNIVKWLVAYDEVRETVSRYENIYHDYPEHSEHKQFIYRDSNSNWHSILGDVENNHFKLIRHYLILDSYIVKPSLEAIDTALAKSLVLSLKEADKLTANHIGADQSIKFNQYVTETVEDHIHVVFLPSDNKYDRTYYACHFHYEFDNKGTNLLSEGFFYEKSHEKYNHMKRSDILKLAYVELEQPTLGVIYSLWKDRAWCRDLEVYTKNNVTVLRKHKNGSHYFWEHMNIKDYEKEQRKRERRRKRRKRQRERLERRIE